MKKHAKIKIYGRVQGVSYRYYTRDLAQRLCLCGIVRNEKDGTVYIEAEGEEDKLKDFIDWCHQGPEWAKVEKVDCKMSDELSGFESFEIKF